MNCPQCQTEMVKARLTRHTEEYDYCRKCKKELKEMPPSEDEFVRASKQMMAGINWDTGGAVWTAPPSNNVAPPPPPMPSGALQLSAYRKPCDVSPGRAPVHFLDVNGVSNLCTCGAYDNFGRPIFTPQPGYPSQPPYVAPTPQNNASSVTWVYSIRPCTPGDHYVYAHGPMNSLGLVHCTCGRYDHNGNAAAPGVSP